MKTNILKLINGEYLPVTVETPDEEFKDTRSYGEKVVSLIREKYSLDEELALERQRDSKPQEFSEYYAYCEECKAKVKGELNG